MTGASTRRETPRIRLARSAAEAASCCDGVARLDPGPRDHWSTFANGVRIPGVVVVADDVPGRYAVSVYLHATITDLRILAGDVRAAIRSVAAEHGLDERLGGVWVAITDVDDGTPAGS